MAWAGVDRGGAAPSNSHGLDGPVDRWRALRDEIHDEVCAHGFDAERNTLHPVLRLTRGSTPRCCCSRASDSCPGTTRGSCGTVDAVAAGPDHDGFLLRYDPGQPTAGRRRACPAARAPSSPARSGWPTRCTGIGRGRRGRGAVRAAARTCATTSACSARSTTPAPDASSATRRRRSAWSGWSTPPAIFRVPPPPRPRPATIRICSRSRDIVLVYVLRRGRVLARLRYRGYPSPPFPLVRGPLTPPPTLPTAPLTLSGRGRFGCDTHHRQTGARLRGRCTARRLQHGLELPPCPRVRGGVAIERTPGRFRIQRLRDRRPGWADAGLDPHVRFGDDVAVPLRSRTQPGDDGDAAGSGAIDDLQHGEPPTAGLAAEVLQQHEPPAEDGIQAARGRAISAHARPTASATSQRRHGPSATIRTCRPSCGPSCCANDPPTITVRRRNIRS